MLDERSAAERLQPREFERMRELVASVLTDMLLSGKLENVGQAKFRGSPDELNIGIEPIDRVELSFGLPSVVAIDHPTGFHKPGNEGPNGGIALKIRGPSTMTPNRPGDLVLSAPEGAIDAQQLYQDGEPVVVIPGPPGSGRYTLEVNNGAFEWVAVDTSSCP